MSSGAPSPGGLEGIVAADSAIGRIDGSVGELRYCGYLIKELAEASSFVETTYLLWHGELPTAFELGALDVDLRSMRELSHEVAKVLRTLAKRQSPMDALRTAVSAISAEDDGEGATDPERNRRRAMRLVAAQSARC